MPTRAASVRIGLGVLLLAAAGLKLFALGGVGGSTVPELGWFAQPQVQLLVAEWELLLGAWLLSGLHARASWGAALITFCAFAVVSGYLGLVGVASCGCLGAVHTNPWWVFGVDVSAAVLLVATRSTQEATKPLLTISAFRWVVGTLIVAFGFVLIGSWYAGSILALQDALRGALISVLNPHVDFGSGRTGDQLSATVRVRNRTDRVVRIIGGSSDCSCSTLDELPVTIPPHGMIEVGVRLVVPQGKSGQFTRRVFLQTDHAEQGILPLRIGCRVE